MTLKDMLTLIVAGVGTAVALMTLIKALLEYVQQGRQKRADQFFELKRRLKDNAGFKRIAGQMRQADFAKVTFEDKRDFLGLVEEVALVVNSGLIKLEVAHYMFGYYAIRCWK